MLNSKLHNNNINNLNNNVIQKVRNNKNNKIEENPVTPKNDGNLHKPVRGLP